MLVSMSAGTFAMSHSEIVSSCSGKCFLESAPDYYTLNYDKRETSIAVSNNQNYKISVLTDEGSYYGGCSFVKSVSQSKIFEQIFILGYRKNIRNKSHNISPNFTNEICTRAP